MVTIYSLIGIDKASPDSEYIYAISYSKEILKNMILNINSDLIKLADFVINENAVIYSLITIKNRIILIKNSVKYNVNNLYAFNKITSSDVKNVLLDITGFDITNLRKLNIFINDLSENKILFDTFYDEGIMNA